MLNEDLIAFLQPAPNRFSRSEWRDVCGFVHAVEVTPERLGFTLSLPAGIYKGRMETHAGAFPMESAMVEMVRVPDGVKVPLGPWDLDHMHGVMALPMVLMTVNGVAKGGLWFNVPGPEEIREGRLSADFGFETTGETVISLELIERDRARFSLESLAFLELRHDERRPRPLLPRAGERAIHGTAERLAALHGSEKIRQARAQIPGDPSTWKISQEDNRSHFDLAALVARVEREPGMVRQAKEVLLALCRKPTWSGRADPLLMGGENDRSIGHPLYTVAVGWTCLQEWLDAEERAPVLAKAEEYLRKMYDFTLLQRGYLGCPSPDAHSLGSWYGVGVACMAFYDELPVAREILPFFHGLFLDALRLFPPGGKANWATYYPVWMARYFAAARGFAGAIPEMEASPFLDHLGEALLNSYLTPNSQELQRGVRTVEHRILSAFLCAFHPTPGIAAIYRAFVDEELRQAGDLEWTAFDLLYAPDVLPPAASFPTEPFFARDIGQVIAVTRTPSGSRLGLTLNAGLRAGARTAFSLPPHNREQPRSLGTLEITLDGRPVIAEMDSSYGLFSANTNAICFGEGCGVAEGLYLHGDLPPEKSACVRRYFLDENWLLADLLLTDALEPGLQVTLAQRTVLLNRRTGTVIVSDTFEGRKPLRFASHLHATGSVCPDGRTRTRLTGGQANKIAGIKFGSVGLEDKETGEMIVEVLAASAPYRVSTPAASWFPSYIYGLNHAGAENPAKAVFPSIRRWRLELEEDATAGHFLYTLAPRVEDLARCEGKHLLLGEGLHVSLGGEVAPMGCRCDAEMVVLDEVQGRLTLLGVRHLVTPEGGELRLRVPVDLALFLTDRGGVARLERGEIFSPVAQPVAESRGLHLGALTHHSHHPRSSRPWVGAVSVS